jgi:tetratricopeptide (TPR) repeat protein
MRRPALALLLSTSLAASALAQSPQPSAAPAASAALAPLPRPSASPAASADAVSADEIDALLAPLTGADVAARTAALADLESPSAALVPAIAKKLGELRRGTRPEVVAAALAATRKRAGDDDERPARKRKGNAAADWLDRALAAAAPDEPAWRDLVSVLALERMLARIGTTPAVRELIAVYPTWGEVFRIDVQRLVQSIGERAVPALIDARRAPDAKLRVWAARQLDVMGKTVPGEAVQTADNQVLAEVLRAYGRTRDVDAVRVIVSFANSDRVQVRDAAREAVVMLGDAALWQLRDSYESLVGKKPPDEWGWERTAQELFAEYDRSRLAEVYVALDEGLAAQRAGKLEEMATAFDRVLARAPTFDRRAETVAGYQALAMQVEATDRPRALALLRKALRVDPSGPRAPAIAAELAFLEAESLAARGVVDPAAYKRALAIDPAHEGARAALDRLAQVEDDHAAAMRRWLAAGSVGVAALLGAFFLLMRRRDA